MASFINDAEKMEDFKLLSKDEFLRSYSYLTEEEYDETLEEVVAKEKWDYQVSFLKDCRRRLFLSAEDIDEMFDLVSEYLDKMATFTEKESPYATRTITNLRMAGYLAYDIARDVDWECVDRATKNRS